MKHLGDITKISGYDAPVVDCIIGGSPCQDLSIAGKRAGLAGERSGLYMEQIRIIKEMREADAARGRTDELVRPRYMVWENVPGAFSSNGGKDFAAVLEEAIRVAEPQAPTVSVPDKGWPTSGCGFCIVCEKEGRESHKVADLSEWWRGQKNIVLMDPNLLACRDHMDLLRQLAESGAWVDINQGLDARLLTPENIEAIKKLKIKEIHFAWDLMKNSKRIVKGLNLWKQLGKKKRHGSWGTVYVLVNYDTTMAENLFRIYKLREMGFDPYVMVYDKPNAPKEILWLQRWCNNKRIFKSCPDFKDYVGGK